MDKTGHTMQEYIGKICPYCKTAFAEGDEIVQCSACEMPHHKDCWIENQGCTTFGCQGTIRGLDGQAYSQMMAAGAQRGQQAAAYQRPVYGQNGYTFAGQSQMAERPDFGAKSAVYGGAAQGAGKLCPNCGAQNIGDSIFCAHCGARMAGADLAGQSQEQYAFGQAPAQGLAAQNLAGQAAAPGAQGSAQTASGQMPVQGSPAQSQQTASTGASISAQAGQSASEQAGFSAEGQSPSGQTGSAQTTAGQVSAGQSSEQGAAGQSVSAQSQPGQSVSSQSVQAGQNTAAPGQTAQAGQEAAAGAPISVQTQAPSQAEQLCPACGASNPGNAAFCYTCGNRLAQGGRPAQASETFCQNCGAKNPAEAVFCYGCGAKLYRPGQQSQPGPDAAHPYDAIKKQGQPRPDAAHPYDAIKRQGSRAGSSAGGGQTASADSSGPVCPGCGTRNAAQAVFCQECGTRFNGAVDPARPYDAIRKQGSKRPAGAAPASPGQGTYRPAGQASAQPYGASYGQSGGQGAYRTAAAQSGGQPYGAYGAAQSAGAYGAAAFGTAQSGGARQGQAAPVYTPPLGTYRVPSYAIPQPRSAAPPTPEEFAEERRLFLGKNEVYYEKKFAQLQGGQLTWNWAAACLTSFWLIYRRMYLWGYLSLLGQIILAAVLVYAWPVAPLLACILFGMFGNRIYLSHVEKEMKLVQRLSKQNRLIEYADKGGVRLAHPLIAGTIIGVYLIALLCSLYI